ncbi:hypothetical protein WIS52_02010 [Pseudonocardia nematodicida]|uniref:Uncharacterized protein n=1 Tax=Pseudonocardia nematodicida TaxID=1206997 RepID=A0ABV1K6K9_9PSEU
MAGRHRRMARAGLVRKVLAVVIPSLGLAALAAAVLVGGAAGADRVDGHNTAAPERTGASGDTSRDAAVTDRPHVAPVPPPPPAARPDASGPVLAAPPEPGAAVADARNAATAGRNSSHSGGTSRSGQGAGPREQERAGSSRPAAPPVVPPQRAPAPQENLPREPAPSVTTVVPSPPSAVTREPDPAPVDPAPVDAAPAEPGSEAREMAREIRDEAQETAREAREDGREAREDALASLRLRLEESPAAETTVSGGPALTLIGG